MKSARVLPIISFASIILLIFLLSVHTLTSIYQDIGRHLTLGRIIWESQNIPDTNLFSFTNSDFPFTNHHWLAEVLLYQSEKVFGLKGLILLKAILVASAFGLALAASWRFRIAVWAMPIGVLSALVMLERTDVRPEILSFLFLGWFLFVLYRHSSLQATTSPATSYSLLWTLPLVQLLWVNSHIYFFMGPLLWLAFLTGKAFSAPNIKSGLRAALTTQNSLLTAAIAIATLLNPHGLSGALYPLSMWGNYGYSIVENQTPFFLRAFGYPQLTSVATYLAIFVTALSFVLNYRNLRRNVFGLLISSATSALALMMVRNFPLLALCFLPVVLKNLDEAWPHRFKVPSWVLVFGTSLLLLFGASIATGQFAWQWGISGHEFGLRVPTGPQEPVDFYRSAAVMGPIFNNFDIGSFLIWKLPEEPVFIDGRPEAYPADFIQNVYIKMQEDPQVWAEQSERYGINAIFWNEADITPWSRTFVSRITRDPHWVMVYRGQGVIILVRDIPENAAIIRQHRLRE